MPIEFFKMISFTQIWILGTFYNTGFSRIKEMSQSVNHEAVPVSEIDQRFIWLWTRRDS